MKNEQKQTILAGKVPAGYQQTEVGIIPEDWEVYLLSHICDVRDGTHESPKYQDYGVPLVTSKNLVNNRFDMSDISFISLEDAQSINQRSQVHQGDILMSMIGTIGSTVLIKSPPNFCIKNVALFKPKKDIGDYLIYLLQSGFYQDYLDNKLDGGIQKFISLGTLRNLQVFFPESKAEQTAIAEALSDVDSLLVSLEKLIEKKRAIKTGTMQQLLTGKKRLPAFAQREDGTPKGYKTTELGEIPEDWEVVKLEDILSTFQLGGNYSNSEQSSLYPLIKMGNMDRGEINLDKLEYIIDIPNQKDRLFFGDILFNTRNTLELVGKVAIWRDELPLAYFNSNIMRLSFNKNFVSNNFYMNFLLNTNESINSLAELATGTTSVAAIYTKDLLNLKIVLATKEEQEYIALILENMSEEIEALEAKRTKTEKIKQGMMQELLTGRTRLI